MKTIDVTGGGPTLPEVLTLAGDEDLILRTTDGRTFVLSEIDELDREVALIRKNEALMQLLAERSQETTKFSLREVREALK